MDPSRPAGAPAEHAALTYGNYLALDEILAAQRPRSDEHDELLFIVIHQVYELWFKQLLHELAHLQDRLEDGDTSHAVRTLRRVLTILKVAVTQIDVLETMSPRQFAGFRGRLDSASGFQSAQFRQLEVVLGRRDHAIVEHYPEESPPDGRSRRRWRGRPCGSPTSRTCAAPATRCAATTRPLSSRLYGDDGGAAQLAEHLVDLDEGLQEWRYRHVKMVERTIGEKPGSGGIHGRPLPALDPVEAGVPRPLVGPEPPVVVDEFRIRDRLYRRAHAPAPSRGADMGQRTMRQFHRSSTKRAGKPPSPTCGPGRRPRHRELDAIAAARRRLPMVELPDYTLEGADGPVRLVDVFEGKPQLIVYNHMWFPDEEWQCSGCTGFTSQFTRLEFLDNWDARFVIVTQGPIDEALAYKARVGNKMEWYSTANSPFGDDMGAPLGGGFQVNVFLRDGDTVYRTYNTQGRGTEQLSHTFPLIDLLPYGRQEEWQDSPEGWPQSPTYSRWSDSETFAQYAEQP